MATQQNYFEAFCKVSKAFGSTLDKKALLDLIVESAITTMKGKAACLFLADEKKEVFIPKAQKGLSDNYLHASPIKAKELLDGLEQKGYLAFKDATTDPRLEHHEAKKAEGIASILTVPVRVSDCTIGVLSLYTAKQKEFKTAEIDFLRALADQGGIAIQNTRLFDRTRRNAQLFLELIGEINSSLDIKTILHNLTHNIAKTLGLKGVLIRLLDEKSDTLKPVASYGLSEAFIDKGPVAAKGSAIGRALQGETVIIPDVSSDATVKYKDEFAREGIKAMLSVPVKVREEVIGVLVFFSANPRRFPDDIAIMAQALGHQGGLAIQNASRHLALKSDLEELKEDIWSHKAWF